MIFLARQKKGSTGIKAQFDILKYIYIDCWNSSTMFNDKIGYLTYPLNVVISQVDLMKDIFLVKTIIAYMGGVVQACKKMYMFKANVSIYKSWIYVTWWLIQFTFVHLIWIGNLDLDFHNSGSSIAYCSKNDHFFAWRHSSEKKIMLHFSTYGWSSLFALLSEIDLFVSWSEIETLSKKQSCQKEMGRVQENLAQLHQIRIRPRILVPNHWTTHFDSSCLFSNLN